MESIKRINVHSQPLRPESDRYGILSDINPGTQTLKAGSKLAPQFLELPVDITLDKDVAVTLRDGTMTYIDIFRPVTNDTVPALVAFSPYGKGQGSAPSAMGVYGLVGLDLATFSGLGKFEGPDPAYWCAQGYAVCNPDIRGVAECEGDSVLWDRQEGRDAYDLIEWLGVQDWCNGKVGMSGTSYLAASQWFTAAERPPHLAAINSWEGMSDTYRDLVMRGGIPDTSFARLLRDNSFWGHGQKEDIIAEAEQYPLINELWENKIPAYDRITVPAYVVASYSNTLHTQGTFRAWRHISFRQKWLRIHNSQEWPDYYDPANREDLRCFFDHFLRGRDDNGWDRTPRVRYSLLDLQGGDKTNIPADAFPPPTSTLTKFYLHAETQTLQTTPPTTASSAQYTVAQSPLPDRISFLHTFPHGATMTGYPKAHLRLSLSPSTPSNSSFPVDDMDIFLLLQKLDRFGTPLAQFTIPNHSAKVHDVTEHGASILRYRGSDGRLRVSLRELDARMSTDEVPVHAFKRAQKLGPGEVVGVDIDMAPVGLVFYPGEQLRFVVSGTSLLGSMMPGLPAYVSPFKGGHVVHSGGEDASFLQLPVCA